MLVQQLRVVLLGPFHKVIVSLYLDLGLILHVSDRLVRVLDKDFLPVIEGPSAVELS